MKLFSDCSDNCLTCKVFYSTVCLAGHGDNDYIPINKEKAKEVLESGKIEEDGRELNNRDIKILLDYIEKIKEDKNG